jgi:hypothetical protein
MGQTSLSERKNGVEVDSAAALASHHYSSSVLAMPAFLTKSGQYAFLRHTTQDKSAKEQRLFPRAGIRAIGKDQVTYGASAFVLIGEIARVISSELSLVAGQTHARANPPPG